MAAQGQPDDLDLFIESDLSAKLAVLAEVASSFADAMAEGTLSLPLADSQFSLTNHSLAVVYQPAPTMSPRPETPPSFGRVMVSNAHESYQPSFGPARTEKTPTLRSEPYRSSLAWPNPTEDSDVEEDPPTPSTIEPAGESTSETTANAGTNQTLTKEEKILRSRLNRDARRRRERNQYLELRRWAKRWKGLDKLPTRNKALAGALEFIRAARAPVYQFPRLETCRCESHPEGSNFAQKEKRRRTDTRQLFEELSKYYLLNEEEGKDNDVEDGEEDSKSGPVWETPALLREVIEELKVHHPHPEASTDSDS